MEYGSYFLVNGVAYGVARFCDADFEKLAKSLTVLITSNVVAIYQVFVFNFAIFLTDILNLNTLHATDSVVVPFQPP